MTKNVIQFCHFVAERRHPKRWPSFKVQGVCVCERGGGGRGGCGGDGSVLYCLLSIW